MQKEKAKAIDIYLELKSCTGRKPFVEEIHCPLMFQALGRMSLFCTLARVSDRHVYTWLKNSELFQECYALAKMIGREAWEEAGAIIADEPVMPGVCNYKYEHWKMVGWSRYGIGKNARIRLELNSEDTPDKHYAQLIKQASEGDLTASEIKQLMESINVGLNVQQVIRLQKEIDDLRKDLATMSENTNGDNTIANKGIT